VRQDLPSSYRPAPPSASPSATHEDEKEADLATQEVQDSGFIAGAAKHEDEKEADLATQEVEDIDFVVGTDPGDANIITIAVSKRAEDGTDGNVRQKAMRL